MKPLSKERFVNNMNVMQLAHVLVDENSDLIKVIANKFYEHFPNHIKDIQHYCFILDFGKCGEEYISPEDFFETLIN